MSENVREMKEKITFTLTTFVPRLAMLEIQSEKGGVCARRFTGLAHSDVKVPYMATTTTTAKCVTRSRCASTR